MISLFLTMLPLYLLGNLHCIGMCGPLVMMLGKHRFRFFYFIGRIVSFSLAGMIAGGAGAVINVFLKTYWVSATTSILFGTWILFLGICGLLCKNYPGQEWLGKRLATMNKNLSLLLLKDNALACFLFGFFTVTLPCGQTLVVFSACALSGDVWIGLFNGFAFALLTSPSLFFSMQAHHFLRRFKGHYPRLIGLFTVTVGAFALFRGLADMELLNHWILNPEAQESWHIVIF